MDDSEDDKEGEPLLENEVSSKDDLEDNPAYSARCEHGHIIGA